MSCDAHTISVRVLIAVYKDSWQKQMRDNLSYTLYHPPANLDCSAQPSFKNNAMDGQPLPPTSVSNKGSG
ncbi:MAG: hypothetical protein WAJ93_03730 [Candidatus Nitrosopolaris sp.]